MLTRLRCDFFEIFLKKVLTNRKKRGIIPVLKKKQNAPFSPCRAFGARVDMRNHPYL